MTHRRYWLFLALAAICAAVLGYGAAEQLGGSGPRLASGTWYPQPRAIGTFSLLDGHGLPFSQDSLRGQADLVYFGFTHCPDVCPTTLALLAGIQRSAVIPGLRVVFVSIDPQRDTPAVMQRYVQAFDPHFIGVTGTQDAIAHVAATFGVAYDRINLPGGEYTMDHTAAVFLLDDAARIVAVFSPPFDAARLAADLRRAAPYLHS